LRVEGSRFRVQGSGLRIRSFSPVRPERWWRKLGRVNGSGLRVFGLGSRVFGLGFEAAPLGVPAPEAREESTMEGSLTSDNQPPNPKTESGPLRAVHLSRQKWPGG